MYSVIWLYIPFISFLLLPVYPSQHTIFPIPCPFPCLLIYLFLQSKSNWCCPYVHKGGVVHQNMGNFAGARSLKRYYSMQFCGYLVNFLLQMFSNVQDLFRPPWTMLLQHFYIFSCRWMWTISFSVSPLVNNSSHSCLGLFIISFSVVEG